MSTSVRLRVRFTRVKRRAWVRVALFSVGLALAFLAQRAIYDSGQWLSGALVYAGAFVFLLAAFWQNENALAISTREPLREIPVPPRAHPARKFFVFPAFLFALLAFLEARFNTFTLIGVSAWLTALALYLVACWEGSPRAGLRNARAAWLRQPRWVALALAGIVILGALFYFYRLEAVPAEMTSDHAEKILDTYDILNGARPIFFERNTGREPLQFYLNALVVALGLAPLDMLALKIVGASAGLLTIPAVFLLARELFDDETGLLAAFFFAVSIFPVAIARVGLRYPLTPLFVAWSCFFLVRALRKHSRNDFLLAGLMLGVGLMGYSTFRVMILLALVWLALWLMLNVNVDAARWLPFARNAAIMFGAALLVFVPLLRYLIENPEIFWYRMATRLTTLEEPLRVDPLVTFFDNNLRAFGMFNVRGDVVWVNAIPDAPALDWVLGACFLIGIAYGAYRLLRYREYPFVLLFAAFFILLLPSTLALAFPAENPSVVRAGGVAPFVMIFAALPLALWRKQFLYLAARRLGDLSLAIVLLATGLLNVHLYFDHYDRQYRRAAWNSTEIAGTLRAFALAQNDWNHIYIVSAPHWVDHRAVGIHLGIFDFDPHLIQTRETLQLQTRDPAPKVYALKNQDVETLRYLKQLYPDGVTRRIDSQTVGRDFVVFYALPLP